VPVAQKAQLVIAARQTPDKVEHAYNGTVVWRLENVGGDEGEPLKSAIRADIDFPDARPRRRSSSRRTWTRPCQCRTR